MKVAKEVKFQVILIKRPDNNVEFDPSQIQDTPVINRMDDIEFVDDQNRMKDCC